MLLELKPGSVTLSTGFSLLLVRDFVAWKEGLCSWYRDDFARATAARKEDQSVGIAGFRYRAARTSDLKPSHIGWMRIFSLKKSPSPRSRRVVRMDCRYAPYSLPVWPLRCVALCHPSYIWYTYTSLMTICWKTLSVQSILMDEHLPSFTASRLSAAVATISTSSQRVMSLFWFWTVYSNDLSTRWAGPVYSTTYRVYVGDSAKAIVEVRTTKRCSKVLWIKVAINDWNDCWAGK